MLNADQIVQRGYLKLDESKGKPAQVGYDLSLKSVNRVGNQIGSSNTMYTEGQIGKVLADKTVLTTYRPVDTIMLEGNEGWLLHPGAYDVTMWEGCKIPADHVAFIRQRSSLLRNGALIHSSVFDPGFETENIGTILFVHEPLFIEVNARIAQIYFHPCEEVDELYNCQWQGDKQR